MTMLLGLSLFIVTSLFCYLIINKSSCLLTIRKAVFKVASFLTGEFPLHCGKLYDIN